MSLKVLQSEYIEYESFSDVLAALRIEIEKKSIPKKYLNNTSVCKGLWKAILGLGKSNIESIVSPLKELVHCFKMLYHGANNLKVQFCSQNNWEITKSFLRKDYRIGSMLIMSCEIFHVLLTVYLLWGEGGRSV